MDKTYTFQISTDHGHKWQTSAVGLSHLDALKHAFRVLSQSPDRYSPDDWPDRYVIMSHLDGQQGWRWMWIRD